MVIWRYRHAHSNEYGYAHSDGYAHAHSDAHPDGYFPPGGDSNAYTHGNAYSYRDAHFNRNPDFDKRSRLHRNIAGDNLRNGFAQRRLGHELRFA